MLAFLRNEFHTSKKLMADDVKVALVDVDETVCFYPNERKYDQAEPNLENIAKINKLYDEGWRILYWTAREVQIGLKQKEDVIMISLGIN